MIPNGAGVLPEILNWAVYVFLCAFGVLLSIVLHELGHVVGAWITHCRIFEISLGSNPRFEKWIGATRLRFSSFPLEGAVVSIPRSLKCYRLRRLITIGLGPAFSLCFLASLFWLYFLTAKSGNTSLNTVLMLLLLLELGMVGRVLWPAQVIIAGTTTGTDGLQLWWTLTRPAPSPSEHARQFGYIEALFLQARGKTEEAQAWIDRIMGTGFEDLPLEERHQWASVFLGLEHWKAARALAETILSDPKCRRGDAIRAETADTFACAALYGGDKEYMPRALEIVKDAISDCTDVITLKGTLGGLLFELQRFDEAEAILHEVIQKSSAAIDHGISSAFLARLAQQRGQFDEARQLAKVATEKCGDMTFVKRVLQGLEHPGLLADSR